MKRMLLTANLLVMTIAAVSVASDPVAEKSEKLSSDQLRTAVQQICPVSGKALGEHGTPVKVKIGKEELFLCCQGCAHGKVDAKNWAKIHANFAKAQATCPVMKKPLPKNPKWTIVQGRIAYVCCPPCIDKIQQDPKTYLAAVDKQYATALQQRDDGQGAAGIR